MGTHLGPLIISAFFPRYDGMHIFDHHGTSAVVAGSVIDTCVTECVALGPNQAARMARVNQEMKHYFDTHLVSSRMPPLRLKNLKSDGWAELNGPLVKAANTRHMMPFVQILAATYLNEGTAEHKAINKVCEACNGVYHALYNSDMFLNDREIDFLREQLLRFGKYHMVCNQFSRNRDEFRFQIKPKAHYAQHIAPQSVLINSRHTKCYCAESLIGKLTTIWKKVAAAPTLV